MFSFSVQKAFGIAFFALRIIEVFFIKKAVTSWDRPKSAPYPRLKNSKKTSKCQVFSFTVLENRFFRKFSKKLHSQKNGPSGAPGPASASPWRAKVSQCRKTEGGPFGIFQHPFCRKTSKKCRGDPLEKNIFRKKSLAVPKKMKGGGDRYVTRKNRKNLFGSVR